MAAGRGGRGTRSRGGSVLRFELMWIADVELQNHLVKFWQMEESYRPRDSYSSIEFLRAAFPRQYHPGRPGSSDNHASDKGG